MSIKETVGKVGAGVAALTTFAVASRWDRRLTTFDNVLNLSFGAMGFKAKAVRSSSSHAEFRQFDTDLNGMYDYFGGIFQEAAGLDYDVETVSYPSDGAELEVHVFRPKAAGQDLPMVVWFHGGGMCIGSAKDPFIGAAGGVGSNLLELCRGRAVIASVHYRMAPEHVFPTPAEDCIAATRWLQANAACFGADPARVSVAGVSAGGYLAAVVSQAARDRGFPLSASIMLAPMCRRGLTTASCVDNGRFNGLPNELMLLFWRLYAPHPDSAMDPRCEPVRGVGAGNLPPCLVVTAEYDLLRDEGFELFEALRLAGVDVEHVRCRGTHVGFTTDHERWAQVAQRMASLIGVAPQSRL